MISVLPIIQRIKDGKPDGFATDWFRQVAGAAEFARLRMEALPLPACWVVRGHDSATHFGERTENVKIAFDVVIAITNARTHTDGDTDEALVRYRVAVKNLLLGYEIDGAGGQRLRPVKFESGQVIEYTDGDIWWRDSYTFEGLVTNYLPDPEPNT
jgi:hypothetical protein